MILRSLFTERNDSVFTCRKLMDIRRSFRKKSNFFVCHRLHAIEAVKFFLQFFADVGRLGTSLLSIKKIILKQEISKNIFHFILKRFFFRRSEMNYWRQLNGKTQRRKTRFEMWKCQHPEIFFFCSMWVFFLWAHIMDFFFIISHCLINTFLEIQETRLFLFK